MASEDRGYRLLGPDGPYRSVAPGLYGGNRKLKIFGELDCRNALRWIARGHYVQHRVFFADRVSAERCGYRPCAICMPDDYRRWKASHGG
ncbi:MAG: metal-binding protein [Pseudomonadota bacterium]